MSVPNMATLTASLERSLQNCSLNHRSTNHRGGATTGLGRSTSSSSDAPEIIHNHHRHPEPQNQQQQFPSCLPTPNVVNNYPNNYLSSSASSTTSNDSTLVELNSHISLPYHWEQCLDLKTGEVYYINRKNGMKAKEDPRRRTATGNYSGDVNSYYSSDDDSYDSDGSSTTGSSPSSASRENYRVPRNLVVDNNEGEVVNASDENDVLVVAGCKRCLMYYMVPKHVEDCLKCNGQLLHFDSSDTTTSTSSISSP